MTVERLLPPAGRHAEDEDGVAFLDDWLDIVESERRIAIQRLRALDTILVKHKRLRHYTLATRVK